MRRKDEANVFLSVAATDWPNFMAGKSNNSNKLQMGYNCPRNATGSYYLQTNSCSSDSGNISRGTDGTTFDKTAAYSACWNSSFNGFCVLSSILNLIPLLG